MDPYFKNMLRKYPIEHFYSVLQVSVHFVLFNRSKSGFYESKIRFSIVFKDKPILDCDLKDPHPKVDRPGWYLNQFLDCAIHLANYFQINSMWPFKTYKQTEAPSCISRFYRQCEVTRFPPPSSQGLLLVQNGGAEKLLDEAA